MIPAKESYFAKVNGGYVIIENVPCYKCEQCGEVVYSATVMEKIEDLLEHLEKIARQTFLYKLSRLRIIHNKDFAGNLFKMVQ